MFKLINYYASQSTSQGGISPITPLHKDAHGWKPLYFKICSDNIVITEKECPSIDATSLQIPYKYENSIISFFSFLTL
jgi:hypothetical protein